MHAIEREVQHKQTCPVNDTASTPWQDTTQDEVTTAFKAVIDQIKIDRIRTTKFSRAMTTGFRVQRGWRYHSSMERPRKLDGRTRTHTQMNAPFMKTLVWIVHYAWWPSGNSTGWVAATGSLHRKHFLYHIVPIIKFHCLSFALYNHPPRIVLNPTRPNKPTQKHLGQTARWWYG